MNRSSLSIFFTIFFASTFLFHQYSGGPVTEDIVAIKANDSGTSPVDNVTATSEAPKGESESISEEPTTPQKTEVVSANLETSEPTVMTEKVELEKKTGDQRSVTDFQEVKITEEASSVPPTNVSLNTTEGFTNATETTTVYHPVFFLGLPG